MDTPITRHKFCFPCEKWTDENDHELSEHHISQASALEGSETVAKKFPHFDTSGSLEQQTDRLINELNLDTIHKENQLRCHKIIRHLWEDLKSLGVISVECYGSTQLGLATKNSDVDVSVVLAINHLNAPIAAGCWKISEYLTMVKTLLEKNHHFKNILTVPQAKIPVIKMHTADMQQVDLTFGNDLAVNNTKFIGYILEQPLVKQLVVILRMWQNCQEIKLSKYCITMLLYYYLQNSTDLVPQFRDVIKNVYRESYYNGWPCSFEKVDIVSSGKEYELGELLSGFFTFAARLDYFRNVICVKSASSFPRWLFKYPDLLPHSQKLLLGNQNKLYVESFKCLIQDPFQLNKCISINNHNDVIHFRNLCKISEEVLTNGNLQDLFKLLPYLSTDNDSCILEFCSNFKPEIIDEINSYRYLLCTLLWYHKTIEIIECVMNCVLSYTTLNKTDINGKESIVMIFTSKYDVSDQKEREEIQKSINITPNIRPMLREMKVTLDQVKKMQDKCADEVSTLYLTLEIKLIENPSQMSISVKNSDMSINKPITLFLQSKLQTLVEDCINLSNLNWFYGIDVDYEFEYWRMEYEKNEKKKINKKNRRAVKRQNLVAKETLTQINNEMIHGHSHKKLNSKVCDELQSVNLQSTGGQAGHFSVSRQCSQSEIGNSSLFQSNTSTVNHAQSYQQSMSSHESPNSNQGSSIFYHSQQDNSNNVTSKQESNSQYTTTLNQASTSGHQSYDPSDLASPTDNNSNSKQKYH